MPLSQLFFKSFCHQIKNLNFAMKSSCKQQINEGRETETRGASHPTN